MKLYCCQKCRKAYIKGRLERKECEKCGKLCREVEVRRPILHYIGFGALAVLALILLVYKNLDFTYRLLLFVLGVIGGFFLVGAGNEQMKREAMRIGGKKAAEVKGREKGKTRQRQ